MKKEETGLILEYIISNLPSHVYLKNRDGIYLVCNDLQANTLGFKNGKEIVGKKDIDLPWDKNVAENFRKNDLEVMKSGTPKSIEETISVNNNECRVVLSQKIPLKDKSNGEIIGVLGISTDITELKNTQAALTESIQKLSVAETERLKFISNVSHEIKGPITNAQFVMNMLLESGTINSALDNDQKELIRMSHNEINHTLESVKFLIAMFDIESKKRVPEYTVFKLMPVIENVKFKLSDGRDDIDIKINIENNIEYIKNDIFIFAEILEVLLKNSIRFSKNKVDIELNIECTSIDGFASIHIKDCGLGISEEFLYNLNKKEGIENDDGIYHNANIRLTYVKKLLNLIGASMAIKSKKGKGTEIMVSFPYENINAIKISERSILNHIEKHSMKKILLVEDNELTKVIEHGVLRKIWASVDTCGDGVSAIKMMSHHKYDIVFLDISLPDIDGIKVLKSARSTMSKDAIFVALTSHNSDDDIENFIKNGFATVISKPIKKSEIDDFLLELMNQDT